MSSCCVYFLLCASVTGLSTSCIVFFFFNDTATTEIYTLSLHDALPILSGSTCFPARRSSPMVADAVLLAAGYGTRDRKSTRLNSSHGYISYAVFCLKKKNYRHPLMSLG